MRKMQEKIHAVNPVSSDFPSHQILVTFTCNTAWFVIINCLECNFKSFSLTLQIENIQGAELPNIDTYMKPSSGIGQTQ